MGNSQASLAAPLPFDVRAPIEPSPQQTLDYEQPRNFHFAVTWAGLFAHLDLIESTGPRPRVETPSSPLALVPVVVAPVVVAPPLQPAHREKQPYTASQPDNDSSAAWEMVVPKMIRTSSGDFTPAAGNESAS